MNNQKIILGPMVDVLMLTGFGLNRAFADTGVSGNAPAGQSDLPPQQSQTTPTHGATTPQTEFNEPSGGKDVGIRGTPNKCQTLDGLSPY